MDAPPQVVPLTVPEMFNALQLTDLLVIDVRSAAAFDHLHIKTALNVDVAQLNEVTVLCMLLR